MGITLEISEYFPDQQESEIVDLERVLTEVACERHRQDEKWGGAGHDDGHTIDEWWDILDRLKLELDVAADAGARPQIRHHLKEIAAVAVAAVQSFDRLNPGPVSEMLDQIDVEPGAPEAAMEPVTDGFLEWVSQQQARRTS